MKALRFDKVAFHGGGTLTQLGPVEDVVCFFLLIQKFAGSSLDDEGHLLLLDRLYKRYLRLDETSKAAEAMKALQEKFSNIQASDIDWHAYGVDDRTTSLQLSGKTLADVTNKYFPRFAECASAAIYNATISEHPFFKPVRISRSDFHSLWLTEERPYEEYDTLEGPPFWLNGA